MGAHTTKTEETTASYDAGRPVHAPAIDGAAGPRSRRPPRTVRRALGWLVLAVLLPLVVAGAAFITSEWKEQREAALARLLDKARTVQRTVDRELSLDQAVLRTLAESGEIDRRDWRSFHLIAAKTAAVRPQSWFVLYDRENRTIVNTRLPFGAGPLPNFGALHSTRPEPEWEGRKLPMAGGLHLVPFETQAPSFSGLIYSPVLKRPAVGTNVPVLRDGRPVYGLSLVYSSQFFEKVLQAEAVPNVVTALFDQRGRFIARTRDSEKFVGLEGPRRFRDLPSSEREGVGEAPNVEGIPFVYAFSRSAVNDYLVAAGMPRSTVLAPAWRALWLWLAVLASAGALGAFFAFRLWRRVGSPLVALARQARSVGEHADVAYTGVEEVEALRQALQERTRAEEALRDAERHYRTLAENAPEVIARLDRQLRHTYVNEYGAKLYGVPARDVIGKTTDDLGMPPEKVALWNRHFQQVLATGQQVTVDFDFDSPTVGKQFFSSLFVPEKDARGEVVSIVAITRDVTQSKRGQEALRRANERLREADRRKDEFLGMLSHELRNPLAPIRNSVYILHHAEPASEQARRARAMIERQTNHLTRIVDDLLDVTRIARGKILLHRDRVDLREIVSRAAEDAQDAVEQRGLTLRVALPDGRIWADADATRIGQVIGNLLNNATKFTQDGGEIALTLRDLGDAAEIRVRDTGAGIDAELLPNVFEPFVQGKRTLARSEGGVGLGLALVKGVIELHGGSVTAHSDGVGKGAEFLVRLPLVGPAVDERPSHPHPLGAARARHVLVVDDNRDAAHSLAELVGLFGHHVEIAYDGPSAIETVRRWRPDVVLCDIGLRGMSGYDVAQVLRAEHDGPLRLVAVSGYAQAEDVERATAAGFDAHVAKPPDPEKIEQLLA